MDRPPINPKPVVEPGADELEHGELTTHALRVRIRQQEILAELSVLALQARPFLELLNETPRLTAEGMEAEFCKVLEFCRLKIGFWFAQASVGTRASSGWQRSGLILSPLLVLPCVPGSPSSAITLRMSNGLEPRSSSSNTAFAAP